MSAVVAVVAPAPGPADRAWLTRATALSSRAAPDGSQSRFEGVCGLGHARLRTGAAETGQPLTLDGRVWLSADVRLDARRDLVVALRSAGARVTPTSSDAELVLHAYAAWDERFLERVAGDFALVLWDANRQRLLCARDQLGVAPLHYACADGRLLVATGVDALRLHPAVSDHLDDTAIADFLAFGMPTDPAATTFAVLRRLPPAHLLTWAAGAVRVRRYWQLDAWRRLERFSGPQEGAERFRELLDAAVADRLTGDRATVPLSGGMDSTSVAASAVVALRARGAPDGALRALTGVLGGDSGDREGEFAALVARELGLPFDVVDASTMSPLDPFSEPVLLTPEPTTYRYTDFDRQFARLPARHAPIALSGHGGDALLMFVPWYWLEWLARGRVARAVRALADQVRLCGGRPRPHLRTILRARSIYGLAPASVPAWVAADCAARTGVAERARERSSRLPLPKVRDLDARSLVGQPMWSSMFELGDPSVTREAVRFRYPLVDLRLLHFVLSLAPEPWLVDKRVLRDAGRGRLPEPVWRRPKTPLVSAVTPGATQATLGSLAELVRRCPDLERFVDRERLADAVTGAATGAGPGEPRRRGELGRGLGLAHWLWHRSTAQIVPGTPAAS